MSYTVTNDDGVIQVRASITTRAEMEQLAKALSNAEQHLPVDPPAADKPDEIKTVQESPYGH